MCFLCVGKFNNKNWLLVFRSICFVTLGLAFVKSPTSLTFIAIELFKGLILSISCYHVIGCSAWNRKMSVFYENIRGRTWRAVGMKERKKQQRATERESKEWDTSEIFMYDVHNWFITLSNFSLLPRRIAKMEINNGNSLTIHIPIFVTTVL